MQQEFDVVVAGGGIAGLTAGLTSARLGRRTLVLTGDVIGGQLLSIEKIEGVPGYADGVAGYDLCPITQEQATNAGAQFEAATVDSIAAEGGAWRLSAGGSEYLARGVILANGARLKTLNVPGEERLQGKGVSHCASCDAPLLRGRVVAVVGGGDSAMQEALTLAASVSRVIVLQRGAALTGQAAYRERVTADPKIELRYNVEVEEILGDAAVSGLRVRDAAGASAEVEAAAVFVYIGLQPNSEFLQGVVPLDPEGRIATDEGMRTALAGICAAGSVRNAFPGRAASAAGDGAAAAITIDRYLTDGIWGARLEASAAATIAADGGTVRLSVQV